MKISNMIWILGLMIVLLSCEKDSYDNDPKFKLEFSDGTGFDNRDILFYDSSSHIFFLKKALDFDQSINGFRVIVENDTIYKGTISSCFSSLPPESDFYISDCFFYGKDIFDIGSRLYSGDLRNDPRIISSLKNNNLVRNGLSCTIDSINIKDLATSSEVFCKITVTNHDREAYYIIDPAKMGELDFNYYTGGLSFVNLNTGMSSFLRWSVSNPEWADVTIGDFRILPGNAKVSYSFKSSDYYKMESGLYKARFRFSGLQSFIDHIDITQSYGRIWIGDYMAVLDSIRVQ